MATVEPNAVIRDRFERLLARTVRRARVTRFLADSPTYRIPTSGGAGVLSLDDVGPPDSPAVYIVAGRLRSS